MNISANRSRSKLVVAIAAGALIGGSLPVFLVSSLSPRISADLGLGEAALGSVVAAFFLAAAASSVPGGRIADRLGAAASLRIGLTISVVAGFGVILLAAGPWSLAACLFLAGTSLGFIDTGGARAIAAAIPLTRQGLAFGGKEASIPAASLLAGIAVPLLGAAAGWRAAFVAAVGYAALLALVVPRDLDAVPTARQLLGSGGAADPATVTGSSEHPSAAPAATADQSEDAAMPDGAPATARDALPATARDALPATARDALPATAPDALPATAPVTTSAAATASTAVQPPTPAARRWPLVALAISAALGGGAAASAATFLVPSAVAGGMDAAAAGLLLASASVAGILSRLSVGAVADRRIGGELRIVAVLLGLGVIGVLGLASGVGAVLVPAAALAIGGGWGWTGLVFLAAVRLDPDQPAKAAGAVLAGLGVGGASGPAVFGWLAGGPGFSVAWVVAAGAFLLAVGFTTLADILRRRPAGPARAH